MCVCVYLLSIVSDEDHLINLMIEEGIHESKDSL